MTPSVPQQSDTVWKYSLKQLDIPQSRLVRNALSSSISIHGHCRPSCPCYHFLYSRVEAVIVLLSSECSHMHGMAIHDTMTCSALAEILRMPTCIAILRGSVQLDPDRRFASFVTTPHRTRTQPAHHACNQRQISFPRRTSSFDFGEALYAYLDRVQLFSCPSLHGPRPRHILRRSSTRQCTRSSEHGYRAVSRNDAPLGERRLSLPRTR